MMTFTGEVEVVPYCRVLLVYNAFHMTVLDMHISHVFSVLSKKNEFSSEIAHISNYSTSLIFYAMCCAFLWHAD